MKSTLTIILALILAAVVGCDVNRPSAVDLHGSHATGAATFNILAASTQKAAVEVQGRATAYAAPGAFWWFGHLVNVAKGAVVFNTYVTNNIQVGSQHGPLAQVGSTTQPLAPVTVNTPDVSDKAVGTVTMGAILLAIIIAGGLLLHHILAKRRIRKFI